MELCQLFIIVHGKYLISGQYKIVISTKEYGSIILSIMHDLHGILKGLYT